MAVPAKRDKSLSPIPVDAVPNLSPEETILVNDYLRNMRFGPTQAAIMTCSGQYCEFADKCPLIQINKLPAPGTECPVEKALIKIWTEDIVRELDISDSDVIDQTQVRNLINMRLLDKRTYEKLAKESLTIKEFRSMAIDGSPIYETKLHPLVSAIERHHKIQDRILATLIATREAKSKDRSRGVSGAQELLSGVIEKMKQLDAKTIDADVRDAKDA